jgi:hypothetical protein
MNEPDIGQQTSALAMLQVMAQEIAPIERLASDTPDWNTAPHLGMLADGFRNLLDFFTQLPGIMDEAAPWEPTGSGSTR